MRKSKGIISKYRSKAKCIQLGAYWLFRPCVWSMYHVIILGSPSLFFIAYDGVTSILSGMAPTLFHNLYGDIWLWLYPAE